METCVMIPISTNRTLEPFFLFVFSLLFERMPTRIFIDIWFTMATHIWIGLFAVIVATSKSHIFKNLNLRKKADRNFCGTFLKNRFRHLKLYSNLPSWLARSRCHMGTFWKTKDWSSHFWESQPFRFWYVEVHRQRRLKSTKTGIFS